MTTPTPGSGVEAMRTQELLDRVTQAQDRVTWNEILAKTGLAARPQVAAVAEDPAVTPLDGLAAGARLVEVLAAQRWVLVRSAREDGASWDQVGATLHLSGEQARAWYADQVDSHERYAGQFYDTPRDRAVLDDAEPVQVDAEPVQVDDVPVFDLPAAGYEVSQDPDEAYDDDTAEC